MIHNKIPEDNKAIIELKSIISSIKINIVRFKDTENFINNNVKDANFLITTRIDHDDMIYNNAVFEIQNKCNSTITFIF